MDAAPHLLDATMFWNPAGGVRRAIGTKHALLGACGWRHTVLAPGADPAREGPGHVDVRGLPLPGSAGGYRMLLRRGPATRLIEAARPDVIEVADPYTLAWSALEAAERLQVPAVAFCHSHLPSVVRRFLSEGGRGPRDTPWDTRDPGESVGPGLATRWRARSAAWAEGVARRYLVDLYSRFPLVLAPSRWMAAELTAWGVPRVALQPLGVDCTVFSPARHDARWRAALMEALELPPATRLVVYCGRFAAEKRLDLLAEAVRRLGPGHVLVAVGAGPRPPRSRHQRALRVLPTLHDPMEVARLVASADAFVHAGREETFGLAVLEAMACGTPVIAARSAGLAELIDGAGVALESDDPGDWADAIAATLRWPSSHLVWSALQRAHAHDWMTVIGSWLQRYRSLMPSHAHVHARPGDPAPGARAPARRDEAAVRAEPRRMRPVGVAGSR